MANENEKTSTREEVDAIMKQAAEVEKACYEAAERAAAPVTGATKRQARMVIRALAKLFRCSALNTPADSEFKRVEFEWTKYGAVMVVADVGRKNDEGTMASVLSRYHAQFWVGPKGGIMTYGSFKKGGTSRRLTGKDALRYIGSYRSY